MGVLILAVAVAQFGRRSVLNPRTYSSASGQTQLWVNPDRPTGDGSATYRLTVDGKVRWTKILPITVREGGIADDGTAGGYGYLRSGRTSELVVVVIRPDGTLALKESHALQPSPYVDHPADPRPVGLLFDPVNDRMTVRIADPRISRGIETWWTYRISTATREADQQPSKPENCRWIIDVRPIPGTRLSLLDWWRFDDATGDVGATFSLVDENIRSVWQLDLPKDYAGGSKAEQEALLEEIREKGAILSVSPGQFELRHVKAGLRVKYTVRDGQVTKIGQAPYVSPPKPALPRLALPPYSKLVVKGKTTLPVHPSTSPIHDVGEFFVLPQDRIVFLQGGGAPAVVEVDGQGHLRRSVPLGLGGHRENEECHLAWTGGNRFVLTRSFQGSNVPAEAWRIDLDARRKVPLKGFVSHPIDEIAGRPDGSFVVLSTESSRYSSSSELAYYDVQGRQKWLHSTNGGYRDKPEEMLSPEDVEIDAQGRIVVIDNIAYLLQRFDLSGKHLGNVDLQKQWRREPSYPTNVANDIRGGLLVLDSGAERPVLRLRPDGTILNQWQPRLPNGKTIDLREGPHVDSKGRVWITNGHAFYRLNANGIAELALGTGSSETIREIGDLFVAPSGTIYALDAANQNVHVFDKNGRSKFVARPEVDDFDERPFVQLEVARSGDIYLSGGKKNVLLHFSPSGKRLPDQPIPPYRGSEPEPQAASVPLTWRWLREGLIDEQGHVRSRVKRWPNGDWLNDADEISAPDGRFLAFDLNPQTAMCRFATYSASGLPERMGTFQTGSKDFRLIAYDGKLMYGVQGRDLILIGLDGKVEGRFLLPSASGGIFPTPDGFAWFDNSATIVWYVNPATFSRK